MPFKDLKTRNEIFQKLNYYSCLDTLACWNIRCHRCPLLIDCCNYVCQTSSFYVKWLIRSISSEKLAGLLQPVINDVGQPCLTSTSRAQLSTGPPLCFPRGLSLIVYTFSFMPCAQRKPSSHRSNRSRGTVLGVAKLNFLQEKRDCCITCRLSSKSWVLSEAHVICEIVLMFPHSLPLLKTNYLMKSEDETSNLT